MAGLSAGPPFPPTREVTPEEREMAHKKRLPTPILILLSREQEWLEYIGMSPTSVASSKE